MPLFHLYFDDSGSRDIHKPQAERADGMNYFALGGVLISENDIGAVLSSHAEFVARWGLRHPLHSTKIRGKRSEFYWLSRDQTRAEAFYEDLNRFVLDAPIISISCVIDRQGYVNRYAELHVDPWLLCQTAFAILIERAAKYADEHGNQLVIYFEGSGEREDRDILKYMRCLKTAGMPFPGSDAAGYSSLSSGDFRKIIQGEPNRITKKVPMVLLADLVLYAMAKGGYDNTYPPYRDLHHRKRIIDAYLKPDEFAARGVKYSCFETKKARTNPSL